MRQDRSEEKICVDSLVHFLRAECKCEVSDLNPGEEPPDFWLCINGQRFAVEVTMIVFDEGYRADVKRLGNEVRNAFQQFNLRICGKHALSVNERPRLPRPNSDERRSLVEKIGHYCGESASFPVGHKKSVLTGDYPESVTIEKLADDGAKFFFPPGPSESRWGGEAQAEIKELMREAIDKKRKKLAKIKATGSGVILALYDRYETGDTNDARCALGQTVGFDWSHSIFWVASFTGCRNQLYPSEPGRRGEFLYSKNQRWVCGAPGQSRKE